MSLRHVAWCLWGGVRKVFAPDEAVGPLKEEEGTDAYRMQQREQLQKLRDEIAGIDARRKSAAAGADSPQERAEDNRRRKVRWLGW